MPDATTNTGASEIWIEPSWLLWDRWVESEGVLPTELASRPYEIHQHACGRLADDSTDLDRVDAIIALRRVVALRVKRLQEIYELAKLPRPSRIKDLELLASFDIVRPFMLKRLIEIRNFVEHQDSKPPSNDECLMFADLIWYFLRSTDNLVRRQALEMRFYPPGEAPESFDHPTVGLTFPDNFSQPPEINAYLNPSSFSREARVDWMMIQLDEEVDIRDNSDESLASIMGRIRGTDEQMTRLYQAYFRHSTFW
jgi:hypothetical protein